ncbi:MAG: hypothetical protein P8099_17950 [Gemmatimonadota bacterium]
MTDLSKKLQIKDAGIRVVNAPEGLRLNLPAGDGPDAGVLLFVRDRGELDEHGATALDAALAGRLAWIAYPKAGQLGTDLSRDVLWDAVKGAGVRPVRQIAIDDVWTGMRFRGP